jgi:hypothetical protein
MRGLTDDLLQLARTDSAQKAAKFERLDLSMLLKDVIDSLRSVAEEKGLQLIDQVPDAGLTLQGDRDALTATSSSSPTGASPRRSRARASRSSAALISACAYERSSSRDMRSWSPLARSDS